MEKLSLGESIELIKADEHHTDGHSEGADPHYWIAPKSAAAIASSVKSLLCRINPEEAQNYEANFRKLSDTISYYDRMAADMLTPFKGRGFMIFHPALGYIARDYGIRQIAVETEGKEPAPSSMKERIDTAVQQDIIDTPRIGTH